MRIFPTKIYFLLQKMLFNDWFMALKMKTLIFQICFAHEIQTWRFTCLIKFIIFDIGRKKARVSKTENFEFQLENFLLG